MDVTVLLFFQIQQATDEVSLIETHADCYTTIRQSEAHVNAYLRTKRDEGIFYIIPRRLINSIRGLRDSMFSDGSNWGC